MNFYVSIFKDFEVPDVTRFGEGGPVGTVLTASFKLFGKEFVALNGGPEFGFTETVSFLIDCKDQDEVDYYWTRLAGGGEESMCGWLKDHLGLSLQVIPSILVKLLQDEDPEKANRVMQAMLQMKKIEIADLQQAYAQD